jgi:hypothetical protein
MMFVIVFCSEEIITVHYVGFGVLTAVVAKSSVFWDVTPCSPLKINQCSGGTSCLHLQCRRVSQSSACYLPHAGFLLGLFFSSEDGGYMFLQSVG